MPDPDIPVEVRIAAMRANADFLETMHLHHAAKVLRDEADKIEREHTERDAFINELAKVYADGRQYLAIEDDRLEWEDLDEENREAIRAGIRAVLTRLDELNGEPDHDTKTLRQWSLLRDVPDDVLAVFTPHGTAHRDDNTPNGWRWDNGSAVTDRGLTSHCYYIELPGVIDG